MIYAIKKSIKADGYPVNSSKYLQAHRIANELELKKYGISRYNVLKNLCRLIPKNELLGKHTKTGQIFISSRVPLQFRSQVLFHEQVEHSIMEQ